jgi:hypothetical protein
MAQLVTLAHRVSGIHARYSKIHDALFSVSLFKKRPKRKRKAGDESAYVGFESDLKDMVANLAGIDSMISQDLPMEPTTTFSRKFATVLKEYITALSTSIVQLSEICSHRDRWDRGEEPYDPDQSRVDRMHYDESLQHHRALGVKLSHMAARL